MNLHEHEKAIVGTFFASARRERWLTLLANPKRRKDALDKLNHFHDFDPRYVTPLPSSTNVGLLLRAKGAPEICHVISDIADLDGRDMPLDDALSAAEIQGWGTLVGCLPGRLGYYYGEQGEQRLLLEKPASSRL